MDHYDVVIIGSGPGGGTMAKQLCEAGFHVALLERGPRFVPPDYLRSHQAGWEGTESAFQRLSNTGEWSAEFTEALNPAHDRLRSKSNGELVNTLGYRGTVALQRVLGVGGSTLHFQAVAERFSPDAFRMRTLDGVGVDWPLTYDELAPYYEKVEHYLGVSGPNHGVPNPSHGLSYASQYAKQFTDKLGWKLEEANVAILSRAYGNRPKCDYTSGCVRGCPTGAKASVDRTFIIAAENTGKLRLLTRCKATKIGLDAKGLARHVDFFDENGLEQRVEADVVVVSGGAVETPRLLLFSACSVHPNGLANSSGLVGTHLMQSLYAIHVITVEQKLGSYRGIAIDNIGRDYCDTRKEHSFARGWHFNVTQTGIDMMGPASYARRLAPMWGTRHKDFMENRFGNALGLNCAGEQLPYAHNRVTLDPSEKDSFGIPLPRVAITFSDNDFAMMHGMREKLHELENAFPSLQMHEELYAYDMAAGGAELRGSCRMGANAADSVVNSFGQSHDIKNLFIMDASVFATGYNGNPSLTVEALSWRGAEYLIQEAKAGNLK